MAGRDQYKNIAAHLQYVVHLLNIEACKDGNVLQDKDGNDIQFDFNGTLKSLEHILGVIDLICETT